MAKLRWSRKQLLILYAYFHRISNYIINPALRTLARKLRVEEVDVACWFRNRRTQLRRNIKKKVKIAKQDSQRRVEWLPDPIVTSLSNQIADHKSDFEHFSATVICDFDLLDNLNLVFTDETSLSSISDSLKERTRSGNGSLLREEAEQTAQDRSGANDNAVTPVEKEFENDEMFGETITDLILDMEDDYEGKMFIEERDLCSKLNGHKSPVGSVPSSMDEDTAVEKFLAYLHGQ